MANAAEGDGATFERAQALAANANWREAYDTLRPMVVSPKSQPGVVARALPVAISAAHRLGQAETLDRLLEEVATAHARQWTVLVAVAQSYADLPHHGVIVAGEFFRAPLDRAGRQVDVSRRDRLRALQLYFEAEPLLALEQDAARQAEFYWSFALECAHTLNSAESWRLQVLTPIATLPDYDDPATGESWQPSGAPVDAQGLPALPRVPRSLAAATSDGERFRWLQQVARARQTSVETKAQYDLRWAQFLRQLFDTSTLHWGGGPLPSQEDTSDRWKLEELAEDQYVARLANGVRRFALPPEYSPIAIFRQLFAESNTEAGRQAGEELAGLYENRRQFGKAAEMWRLSIQKYPKRDGDDFRVKRLRQIVGDWCEWEPVATQPAGQPRTLGLTFRNAKKVQLRARAVLVEKLLADTKARLKDADNNFEWSLTQIEDIGQRLLQEGGDNYLGDEVARWEQALEPLTDHRTGRTEVSLPLPKAGAFLVEARVSDYSKSEVVVWLADLAIVTKAIDGGTLLFVADAETGTPVSGANIECFGWTWSNERRRRGIGTRNFALATDANGMATFPHKQAGDNHQWMFVARDKGRLAHHGFAHLWQATREIAPFELQRLFVISDRPIYRPTQTVHLKLWAGEARYDAPAASPYAGRTFVVEIRNPQSEVVTTQELKADEYGGVSLDYTLPAAAALGQYEVTVKGLGAGSFRVEEYRRPEFEVVVTGPDEAIRLGEAVTAKVTAKYFFGGSVKGAKAHVKVLRSARHSTWHPPRPWDWLYGPGYWWFGGDYAWYPGFRSWGCVAPPPMWWQRGHAPPELLQEADVVLDENGEAIVTIDTAADVARHGQQAQDYRIDVEVTDDSRRTMAGSGTVTATQQPFRVFVWIDRGYLRVGDTVDASLAAYRPDGKAVTGSGVLKLLRLRYENDTPIETEVQSWDVDLGETPLATQKIAASEPGQYRLSYRLKDARGREEEGGLLLTVLGKGFDGRQFRFNDLELITDKPEYAPGESVKLLVQTNRTSGTVLLFVRANNGVAPAPQVVRLDGKASVVEIPVELGDMPNFFIEAVTVSSARVHQQVREIAVPPASRVTQVTLEPEKPSYQPGEKARARLKLRDEQDRPVTGSTVVAVYDRSLDLLAGGSNVDSIREAFWKWRRSHQPQLATNLRRRGNGMLRPGSEGMQDIGPFNDWDLVLLSEDHPNLEFERRAPGARMRFKSGRGAAGMAFEEGLILAAPMATAAMADAAPAETAAPALRTNFAETALWLAKLEVNADGEATLEWVVPDSLTSWSVKVWTLGSGCRVGEGATTLTTRKDVMVRLQTPRFLTTTDEIVLSAIVHNETGTPTTAQVTLEIDEGEGCRVEPMGLKMERLAASARASGQPGWDWPQTLELAANSQQRVDWRMSVHEAGQLRVRVKAVSAAGSDAMQTDLPIQRHAAQRVATWSGMLRGPAAGGVIELVVPAERLAAGTQLEARFSPTLAGALVDALPYLVEYPHGCTEQTLNRFVPAAITQNVLKKLGVSLAEIRDKRTNLNAQQLGDPKTRAAQWKHHPDHQPVFDETELARMTANGLERLTSMQCQDGGWGWFSGAGESSSVHTTAVVVNGLLLARQEGLAIVPGVRERGLEWLQSYAREQVRLLELGERILRDKNERKAIKQWRSTCDDLDALVFELLTRAEKSDASLARFLKRDRAKLSVLAKATLALAWLKLGEQAEALEVRRNLEQFLVEDAENQTVHLRLPQGSAWWSWTGNVIETNALYLKLLVRMNPQDEKAPRLVKYLLNHRHAHGAWSSTRETANCIDALAEFLVASGEAKVDTQVEWLLDGNVIKAVHVTSKDLFQFDNALQLSAAQLMTGNHTLELRQTGSGPLYYNVALTVVSTAEVIEPAGLEVRIDRATYRLVPDTSEIDAVGKDGQALTQKAERFRREKLAAGDAVQSGDVLEVELIVTSKNDYEYLLLEDYHGAGIEALDPRSGYRWADGLAVYTEFRDNRTCFFARTLPEGTRSLGYRLRAETPGVIRVLPAQVTGLYAPELRGNSRSTRLTVAD